MQWISIRETNCNICWIEIYPLDSIINLFNNWGQVSEFHKRKFSGSKNLITLHRAMINLLHILVVKFRATQMDRSLVQRNMPTELSFTPQCQNLQGYRIQILSFATSELTRLQS